MVEVKEPVIIDREKNFVADEIWFTNFVVSDYSNPIAPDPRAYAEEEYDQATKILVEQERVKHRNESKSLGLPGETLDSYVNLEIEIFKNERKNEKSYAVHKRTNELLIEIPKGLKNLKRL